MKFQISKKIVLQCLVLTAASFAYIVISLGIGFNATANNRPETVMHNVPFTRQAPLGEWNDPRQKDGCEEASIVMALSWVRGSDSIHPEEARRDIINMSEYERVMHGFFQDTSIQDTAQLMKDYYNYPHVRVQENISSENIKEVIAAGNLAIIPLNTQLVKSTLYKKGPTRHTIIAVGYDDQKDEVNLHDPFYANGRYLRIKSAALNKALWNYRSGIHLSHGPKRTAMMVVSR